MPGETDSVRRAICIHDTNILTARNGLMEYLMARNIFKTALGAAMLCASLASPAYAAETTSPEAPTAAEIESYDKLDDNTRYLLIMGSVDGFAATGPGAPCFPGKDNKRLDQELKQNDFTQANPATMPGALMKLRAAPEECVDKQVRGYQNGMLKSMPNEHLATYLSGAVRAYAAIKSCPTKNQTYAAATTAAAIFSAADDAQPTDVLTPALAEGCAGPKK